MEFSSAANTLSTWPFCLMTLPPTTKLWGFLVPYVIRWKVRRSFRHTGPGIRDSEGTPFMLSMSVEVLVCMTNSSFSVDTLIIKTTICKSLIFYEKDFPKPFDVFTYLIKTLKIILKYLCKFVNLLSSDINLITYLLTCMYSLNSFRSAAFANTINKIATQNTITKLFGKTHHSRFSKGQTGKNRRHDQCQRCNGGPNSRRQTGRRTRLPVHSRSRSWSCLVVRRLYLGKIEFGWTTAWNKIWWGKIARSVWCSCISD